MSTSIIRGIFPVLLLVVQSFGDPSIYQLKNSDGKIVAKLSGSFSFQLNSENGTKSIDLPSAEKLDISGFQTNKTTTFSFIPLTIEQNGSQLTSVTIVFSKDEKSAIYIEHVLANFSSPSSDNKKQFVIEWTKPVQLGSNSSLAFLCSEIQLVNGTNLFTIKKARLQPFDLKNGNFGDDEICPKDEKPTTTAPITTPAPQPFAWTFSQDGFSCIRLTANITLHITYYTENGGNATAAIQVPHDASVTGNSTCHFNKTTRRVQNEQTLQLQFPVGQNQWYLMFNFTNDSSITRDAAHSQVQVYYVQLSYVIDEKNFPNASTPVEGYITVHNNVNKSSGEGALALFKADMSHNYRCNSAEKSKITADFVIMTHDLKAEAFLNNSTKFLDAERICVADEEDEASDLVPIITGAALAALVLFVLIAYLVGRARAKQSTYETI